MRQLKLLNLFPETSSPPLVAPENSVQAITLWRPWADWVILGWKSIETRTHCRLRNLALRPTKLAIHAGKKWDNTAIDQARKWLTNRQIRKTEHLKYHPIGGHVIGTVTVISFHELGIYDEPQALIECQSVTRYGLGLVNPKLLVPPLETTGRQGLFRVSIKI